MVRQAFLPQLPGHRAGHEERLNSRSATLASSIGGIGCRGWGRDPASHPFGLPGAAAYSVPHSADHRDDLSATVVLEKNHLRQLSGSSLDIVNDVPRLAARVGSPDDDAIASDVVAPFA